MAKDAVTIPQSAIDAVKTVAEHTGPTEINALSQQLNKLSFEQLRELNSRLPEIGAAERKTHPNLPDIKITFGKEIARSSQAVTTNDVIMTLTDRHSQGAPVHSALDMFARTTPTETKVYHRQFYIDKDKVLGEATYYPGTDKFQKAKLVDPAKHSTTETTFGIDGSKVIVVQDPGGTSRTTSDRDGTHIHRTHSNGEIYDQLTVSGKVVTDTRSKDGTHKYSVGQDSFVEKDGVTTHTRSAYEGPQLMEVTRADGSKTSYSFDDEKDQINIDKQLLNGDRVHEEFTSHGKFISGKIMHPAQNKVDVLKAPQESDHDLYSLSELFLPVRRASEDPFAYRRHRRGDGPVASERHHY